MKYEIVVTVRIPGNGIDRHDLIEIDRLLHFIKNNYSIANVGWHREIDARRTFREGAEELEERLRKIPFLKGADKNSH